jgi:hypothetical protein
MPAGSIVIARRFRGPPHSGNGGYVAGCLAAHVNGPARVRLYSPPPLEVPIAVRSEGEGVRLLFEGEPVAEARSAAVEVPVPDAPAEGASASAAGRFRGFEQHPFPGCFVCGPDRAEADGLRIFAGPLDGADGPVAAPWVPDASLAGADGWVAPEFLWAALDCPGAFAFPAPERGTILLGEIAADIRGGIRAGERCRMLAWELAAEGRKHFTASVLYGESGKCVAVASATWIEVATPMSDVSPGRRRTPPSGHAE